MRLLINLGEGALLGAALGFNFGVLAFWVASWVWQGLDFSVFMLRASMVGAWLGVRAVFLTAGLLYLIAALLAILGLPRRGRT